MMRRRDSAMGKLFKYFRLSAPVIRSLLIVTPCHVGLLRIQSRCVHLLIKALSYVVTMYLLRSESVSSAVLLLFEARYVLHK